jgi:hypothetical protein
MRLHLAVSFRRLMAKTLEVAIIGDRFMQAAGEPPLNPV